MISGEKILVTGVTGNAPLPVAEFLARENEVWGVARFNDEARRARVEAAGIRPHAMDLSAPDFSTLPDDFSYVLHWTYTRMPSGRIQQATEVNAIAAGLVLQHCRQARAALVVSAGTVYSPRNDDVYHAFHEDDDIGGAFAPWGPSGPASKVSLEAVARFCARAFDLPTTIARLNVVYGPLGGMPVDDMRAIAEGRPVHTFADPYPASPIHADEMCAQLEAMLAAAGVPATLVNWCGDEVVTQREWIALAEELTGRKAEVIHNDVPSVAQGSVGDTRRRREITGPCRIPFADAMRHLHEELCGA
jgi:nucleoside-diphosphate-sugar epimerase